MYAKVLVPLDGTDQSKAVLPHVTELAAGLGSEVILLRPVKGLSQAQRETRPTMVAGTSPTMVDLAHETAAGMRSSERDAAAAYLEHASTGLRERGIRVRSIVVEGGEVSAIVEYARAEGVDLIAMRSRRRGRLARHLLGSVTDKVLRSSPCPLLLLPIE